MKKKLYLFSMLMMLLALLFQINAQQWVVYDGSVSPDAVYEANGSLGDLTTDTIIDDPMITGNKLYMYQVADGAQFNWRAPLDASVDSFTFVARVKANLASSIHVVNFNIRNGVSRVDVRIEDDVIKPSNGMAGTTYDLDMNQWHIIRSTFVDSILNVYVDEDAVPVIHDTIIKGSGDLYFRWGDASGGDTYGGLVDWVIFDSTGVYAPGEGDPIPDSLAMNHGGVEIMLIELDKREQVLADWLELQGFEVTRFWPGNDYIDDAGQDTIDMINAADLVIIGRSGPSTSFQDSVEVAAWNAITAPVMCICPWKSRSSRMKLFNSGTCHQKNDDSPLMVRWAHVETADQADPVFTGVNFTGDSMPWSRTYNDFISVDSLEEINGDVLAVHTLDGSYPVLVRFAKDSLYYNTTWSKPASDRTYMGMGNDAKEGYDNPNFFPLDKEAKKVFLNEILRLTGQGPQNPVWSTTDAYIAFVTPQEEDDSYREQKNMTFLENHGFEVRPIWPGNDAIDDVSQDTIDMLNSADLVILGRGGPSTSFQDSTEVDAWNAITAPVLCICPWKSRNSRMKLFNSGSAGHQNEGPDPAYAHALVPDDPIFADVTLTGDSMAWFIPPHDFIYVDSLEEINGEVVALFEDNAPLIVRFEAGVPYYNDTWSTPASDRTYFGMGNDALTVRGVTHQHYFFPMTREAKKVYLAEICRMLGGLDIPEMMYTADDYRITFVAPYEGEEDYIGDNDREVFNKRFLVKNGFRVEDFWAGNDNIQNVGQDTLDLLNNSDLVIIGRSGPSTSFQDSVEYSIWNGITAPVMCICPWKSRNSRLHLFNSGTADHIEEPEELKAKILMPDDPVFSNVDLDDGDTLVWFAPDPHDGIRIDSMEEINGDILATCGTGGNDYVFMVRFEAGVEFYNGSVTKPAHDMTYMGLGHDGRTVGGRKLSHFFPFTDDAQQVYFNELCRMVGAEMRPVVTVDNDARLDDFTFELEDTSATATLTPDFDDEVFEYTLVLVGDTIVDFEAIAHDDEGAYIYSDGELICGYTADNSETMHLICIAENGYHLSYDVEVYTDNTSTKDIKATETIKVYPNPAYNTLNVITESANGQVKIYDAVGKLVLDQSFANNNHLILNIGNLSSGLYLIQVDDGSNIVMGKFLKQ